ncbi:cytochrome c [Paenibacillus sp. ACRRX]|uniref:c-type cytochrome n=1 Tax=unclassified Paenibacillus TaxID=185978 RepID=UPI001EF4357F|nr:MULTISPECIES: cytochrome c [unclassified Paenibacillus]MCG7408536.1 cytochrome c [Paenibacillus sp. ACRRX]MDK8182784.1 cytochrome c [Paenibacillus sp. UMB4589-SE434]
MLQSLPKLRHRKLLMTCAIVLVFALTGCGASSGANNSTPADSAALEGPEDVVAIYKQRCMQCHGTDLKGRMGAETNISKIGSKLTKDDIVLTVKNGGKRMPALGGSIEDADIEKIAVWLSDKK